MSAIAKFAYRNLSGHECKPWSNYDDKMQIYALSSRTSRIYDDNSTKYFPRTVGLNLFRLKLWPKVASKQEQDAEKFLPTEEPQEIFSVATLKLTWSQTIMIHILNLNYEIRFRIKTSYKQIFTLYNVLFLTNYKLIIFKMYKFPIQ